MGDCAGTMGTPRGVTGTEVTTVPMGAVAGSCGMGVGAGTGTFVGVGVGVGSGSGGFGFVGSSGVGGVDVCGVGAGVSTEGFLLRD